MPRYVDHEDRRREIIDAALRIIAEKGVSGLSIRGVAASLGGSVTLVTHYYSSRQALVERLTSDVIASWEKDLESLEFGVEEPRERLRLFLEWSLPLKETGLLEERVRFRLLADSDGPSGAMLQPYDARMRALIRNHLAEIVPTAEVDEVVELLRIVTVGITTLTLEHEDDWPPDRQVAALASGLTRLGLA